MLGSRVDSDFFFFDRLERGSTPVLTPGGLALEA